MAESIDPVVVIVGASSGLGLAIANEFLSHNYVVFAVARNAARLEEAKTAILKNVSVGVASRLNTLVCDALDKASVERMFDTIQTEVGRLNVLINCVGLSDRGDVGSLNRDRLIELFDANVVTALHCSQAAFPMLKESGGVVVNVGSLASKVGARYLGAYPATKHALAGLTQQMRLEWKASGVHVALVCPGPIRRHDEGVRYSAKSQSNIPASAMKPGGGTSVRGLDPAYVAAEIRRCAENRYPEIILPRKLRMLIALGNLWPQLGDWLILSKTKSS